MPESTRTSSPPTDNDRMNAALEYLDRGFSVIPVKRSDKKPYIKWEEFQKRHPTPEEIEGWWTTWPEANVAIVTGKISGIFIVDADGPSGISYMTESLPKTSMYSKTGKGLHAPYLLPKNALIRNSVRIYNEIDIRGEGGYFVAPPSIHENGIKYAWIYTDGLNGWDDIAEYQPPTASIGKTGNLNIDLSGTKASPINQPVAKGSRNFTLAQLSGKWISAGLDDAEIEVLAKTWNSNNSPPLSDKELSTTLQSIRKTHDKNHPHAEPETVVQDEDSFPEHLLNPGGILQEIMDYTTIVNPVAVKAFALAGAITFLGDLMAFKWQTDTGLKTNIYSIALGYSGSGKNAPLKAMRRLVKSQDKTRSITTRFTSGTAILKKLSDLPGRISLMLLDEIGDLMEGMKSQTSHKRDIPETLKTLFSGVDEGEEKNYTGSDTIVVPWSHLSFYGTGTPESFWDSISTGDVAGGLLPRLLIFEYLGESPLPDDDYETAGYRIPEVLYDKIKAIFDIKRPIDKSIGDIHCKPLPKTLPKSAEAMRIFKPWRIKYHKLQNMTRKDPSGSGSIYSRAAEHASKIALILSVSSYGVDAHHVDAVSMQFAMDLIDFLIEQMVRNIKENIVDTDVAKWKQKIIKGIKSFALDKKVPYPGASIRDLQRGVCRGLLKDQLEKVLSSMTIGGEIGMEKFKPATGPFVDYFFIAKSTTRRACRSDNVTGFSDDNKIKSDA